jgi:hypothetical protein
MIKQFNKLRDRNAYLQEFRKEEIFRDDLGELDDSRFPFLFVFYNFTSFKKNFLIKVI